MIGLAYRDSLPQGTADELDQLVQGLTGMLYREHDPDGTHTDITANSLTLNKPSLTNGVTGAITFQDRLGNKVVLYRDLDNYSDDTILRLSNPGIAFRIQRTDVSNVLYNLVGLGLVPTAVGQYGNGILLYGLNAANDTSLTNVYHDWSIASIDTNAAPGARMAISDVTRSISPIALRWRNTGNGIYEWMKTTGASGPLLEQVNLGSGLDASQTGYWDNLYVKSITLGNGAGPTGNVIGTWTNVPFSAGNFTANGAQTWTVASGDVLGYRYMVVGNSMTLAFYLGNTTVGGTPDQQLRIAIPGGYTAAGLEHNTVFIADNGVVGNGQAIAASGNAFIAILRYDEGVWAASTDATAVRGEITFAIA